jgi:hypothetical protein
MATSAERMRALRERERRGPIRSKTIRDHGLSNMNLDIGA